MQSITPGFGLKLVDPNSIENVENRELILKANQLIIDGKQCSLMDDKVETCCSMLAEACEIYTKVYGEIGIECLKPYIYYASALLEIGRREHGVVQQPASSDNKIQEEDVTSAPCVENEEIDGNDEMETDETVKIPDESTVDNYDEDDDDESEKAEPEDESNLRHALTMLDIAILICDKNPECNEIKLEKAECLLKKCEVLQEFDDFQQAIVAVQQSLQIQNTIIPQILRMRAESLYYLGMIFQNTEQYDKASEAYTLCVRSLQERITEIRQNNNDEAEIKELEDIIAELNLKLIDVKMSGDERLKVHVKTALSSTKSLPSQSSGQVDITARLVRKPTADLSLNQDMMEE